MKTCDKCGHVLPTDWHGLALSEHGDVFWRGIKQVSIPMGQASILRTLMARGEASSGSLEMLSDNASGKAAMVQISHLRRVLARYSIPVEIQNIYGWGYRLVVSDDQQDGDS